MDSTIFGSAVASGTDRSGETNLETTLGIGDVDSSAFLLSYDFFRGLQLEQTNTPLPEQSPAVSLVADSQWLFDAIIPYTPYLFAAPFADFLADYSGDFRRSDSDARVQLRYEHGIRLERMASASIYDIFLPQLSQLDFARILRDSPGGLIDRREISLTLRNRATNLFGAFGSVALFDWYDIDDFTLSAALTANYPESVYTFTPQLYASFLQSSNFELGLQAVWDARFARSAHLLEHDGEFMLEYLRTRPVALVFGPFSSAELRHGPAVTFDYRHEQNLNQEGLRIAYSLRLQGSDAAEIGSEIEVGGIRRHILDTSDSMWDFAAAARIFGLIKW